MCYTISKCSFSSHLMTGSVVQAYLTARRKEFPPVDPSMSSQRQIVTWKRTTSSQSIRWLENELQLQQNHEFLSQWKQKVPVNAPVEKEQQEVLLTVKSAIVDGRNLRGCRLTCEMESSKQTAID